MTKPTEKPKRGRPKLSNVSDKTLGRVRVTQDQIDNFTKAAESRDETLSAWVRRNLDKIAKRDLKQ